MWHILELSGEEIDADAALAALQAQYDARKKTLSDAKLRQKEAIQEKLRLRRQEKDAVEFESHAAASMVLLAEKRIQAKRAQEDQTKSKQKSLVRNQLILLDYLIRTWFLFYNLINRWKKG